ncbi:hypothetical protein P4255_27845 [Bacillus wiedmannii]|uniref:hypothetical protein n=1 Tax=Bacillus wiedmannii TaxID=1890302 RepID=UPI002E1ED559|nr:hypothetical protein [Bacillus wiedmannii]
MENGFISTIASEWKSLAPIIAAILGVIGTIVVQFCLRMVDTRKQYEKELNAFKGRLGNLLRKIDHCMQVNEDIKPVDLEKDRAVRILKGQFLKFDLYKNLIDKLNESEEHFVDKIVENKIRKINDNLWKISIYMYQIDDPYEQNNPDFIEITYRHNLELYNNIKGMCEEIKLIEEKL